jgi:uncharacterized repeat protein (TIGR03803 family)
MHLNRIGGAVAALSLATCLWAGAPTCAQVAPPFKLLHSFTGGVDSQGPDADLAVGHDGALYGTSSGTDISESTITPGAVFKITTAGAFTIVHAFTGPPSPGGGNPQCNIVWDRAGNLYGTTSYGGIQNEGTVFQITPAGKFSTLINFDGFDTGHGIWPKGELIFGKDGALYGLASFGGPGGYGTLFQATTSGTLTDLVSFDFVHGSGPTGGLLEDSAGNFYGTTWTGGTSGAGTVFVYVPGFSFPAEYDFTAFDPNTEINSDGAYPYSGLIRDAAGNLYGTGLIGGSYGKGVIFEIPVGGTLRVLYNFTGGSDGGYPEGKLTIGKDGLLYGTTTRGGNGLSSVYGGFGTVFSVWPDGSHLTTLYAFTPADSNLANGDGAFPYTGLTLGNDGNFYGTAMAGGADGDGTLFRLTMVPVVSSFSPTSGPVGTKVTIKGANFTETTGIAIGNKPASYTINSDSSLTLTIPSGATSGKIGVTNRFGKGASLTSFVVTH